MGRTTFNLEPKNEQQREAFEALYNPEVQLVTLVGMAGTGKTLLAIAAGLTQVQSKIYDKVLVSRPIVPMGADIGYMPGTMEEKLSPWTQPIFDSIEFLQRRNPRTIKTGTDPQAYVREGILQVEALTFIRGRSLPGLFVIIDEAQNLTAHEVKTIISRAGEGTKIVLTGDPDQIDREGLTKYNNGLVHVADRFVGQDIHRNVVLTDCVRSRLAQLAAKLL